ncbi:MULTISPECIES: Bax inhibitor-1 family protein [unclassified Cyanobium]|jgi:FtsH-binding integral membrane protein|uniref:Bax inhibitor-1/YccA family protein n=1 Tax=unclassified Cyanobium TaxID=2627006 RepID=UPI0020CF6B70|nr:MULTISPECIES: Bax inhibitor-1 family protein [unclassified Cyanobium]MCP9833649.1 US12 family protein [Cyanobium sp. La Preciosa 7G6]MCP9936593.1 US12 family protein [Cyanobium sp. Aljojuca 7A6]
MPARSNFQEAIREAQSGALIGPNVVNKALPYVGGGMVLTAVGVVGGLSMIGNPIFMPLFWVSLIGNFILFFVAQNAAMKGNNGTALPILTAYSLITGFTLSGIVAMAIGTAGIGAIGTAALATGITFVIASVVGRNMSDNLGQALSGVVGLGIVGLLIAMVVQLVGGIFIPGFGGNGFELMIAGFGTVLFVGAAFVDFYTMPRTYSDDQYLAGALGMYLTYINLFIFILRLIIALQGGGRRD